MKRQGIKALQGADATQRSVSVAPDAPDTPSVAPDAPQIEPSPLIADCQRIANQLAEYGVAVNFGGVVNLSDLKPAIEASAAGVMLVMKGVCSAEEWRDIVHLTLRETLAKALQGIEEQRLNSPHALAVPAHVAAARRGKLALAHD